MTILGIDWGERRIGVAFSRGNVASPLEVLEVKNEAEAVEKIAVICRRLEAEKVVLGIPLDSEGRETAQAERVRKFGKKLSEEIDCEVIFWNEALSSREAVKKLVEAGRGKKSRRELDAASAAVILQDYLNETRSAPGGS